MHLISAISNISWHLNQSFIPASEEAQKFPLFYWHLFDKTIAFWTKLIDADKIKVHGLKRLSNIQFLSEIDLKLHKTLHSEYG